MAAQDLGKLGALEGKPVLVQWRWFDSKPTLPLWIGLLVLLIVPKQNHKWQAWLILVVPLLAAAARLIFFEPLFGSAVGSDLMMQTIVTFAIAWAAVWLLVPYFGHGNRWRAMVSALAVMFAVGIIGYLAYFGFLFSADTLVPAICLWAVGSVSLLLAMAVSGVSCGQRVHSGAIAIWMILWLPVMTAIGMALGVVSMGLILGEGPPLGIILQVVIAVLFGSVFVTVGLYAVNLPVLLLAGLTDCYGDRLRAMLSAELPSASPFGQTAVVVEVLCEAVNA